MNPSRSAAVVLLLSSVWLIATPGWSAEAWHPPTATMLEEVNHVLVATLGKIDSLGTMHWRTREVVAGEPPIRFSIADRGPLPAELVLGGDYLVAITELRHHPLFREGMEKDPEGWRLTEVPGLGPALLPNLHALRRLLRSAHEKSSGLAESLTDVQELMRHEWVAVRRFALLELQLRPSLSALIDQETVEALRTVLDRPESDWQEKQLALAIGRDLAEPPAGTWLLEESRQVLREAPVVLDLTSRRVALVETALEILATDGQPADGALAVRHLGSNGPGVVKRAGRAATLLDCAAGYQEAQALLEGNGSLHLESRSALEALVAQGCKGN